MWTGFIGYGKDIPRTRKDFIIISYKMINSANNLSVANLLSTIDENVTYVVPKYQREYTWSRDNRDALFNDILEDEGGHFIWSMIYIPNIKEANKIQNEVIDWQQRLTTISLLYAAIYKKLNTIATNDEDIISQKSNIRKRLVIDKEWWKTKLELSFQNKNMDDYRYVLSKEIWVLNFTTKVPNCWNRLIYKAFRYFEDKISEYDIDDLLIVLKKLDKVNVVVITVDSHSNAFILFETLNNRWVPLTAIDLIKNKILAELDMEKYNINDAFDKRNQIVSNLEDYTIQERFLRHYYNAFKYQENIKVNNVSKATKSTLIKIYEELISKNAEFMINEFLEKSYNYKCFVDPNNEEENKYRFLNNKLEDLIRVKAAPSYLLLLYLSTKTIESPEDFYMKITDFLIKYFVRRNITDFPNTRNLDQIFIDLVSELEENPDSINADYIIEYLSNPSRMSDIESFKDKLAGDIYEINTDMARFILSKIEEEHNTKEKYVSLRARDKSNKLIRTIEHIFPEGNNIPKEWIDMIANGDKAEAKKIQDDYVHKIGNLTLTWYNSNLSNFSFDKKRDRKNEKWDSIGYKNWLYLNEDIKDKEIWTKDDIEKRTEFLITEAVSIFSTDKE